MTPFHHRYSVHLHLPHTVRHEDCQTWVQPRTMQSSVASPGYRAKHPETWALWAASTVLLWISPDRKRCPLEFMASSCGRITKLVPRVLGQCHVFSSKKLKWKWTCSVVSNSLQPMDCSRPGSSVLGILQARILKWIAILYSRGLLNSGIEPGSPALQAHSLPSEPPGKPQQGLLRGSGAREQASLLAQW